MNVIAKNKMDRTIPVYVNRSAKIKSANNCNNYFNLRSGKSRWQKKNSSVYNSPNKLARPTCISYRRNLNLLNNQLLSINPNQRKNRSKKYRSRFQLFLYQKKKKYPQLKSTIMTFILTKNSEA